MTDYTRGDYGRFGLKSDTPRKVRSVNLTDSAWDWLASTAKQEEMSRNDFLETLSQLERYPFMETVEKTQEPGEDKVTPLMETVEALRKELAEVKAQRDEFDAELTTLHATNGDLNLQITELTQQLADQQSKPTNQEPKPTAPLMETAAPARELPDAKTLLKRLKAKHILFKGKNPRYKIDDTDVQLILDLLEEG